MTSNAEERCSIETVSSVADVVAVGSQFHNADIGTVWIAFSTSLIADRVNYPEAVDTYVAHSCTGRRAVQAI